MSEKRFFTTLANDEYTHIQKKGNPRSTYLKYSEVVDLLNEQQATIRRLQDLCGESDSENAKLRIENKRLCDEIKLLKPVNIEQYEQIVQLQEENEQLKSVVKQLYFKTDDKFLNDDFISEIERLCNDE